MKRKDNDFQNINKLMGTLDYSNFKYIDAFVSDQIGIFMPISDEFQHMVTSFHSHPSYFIVMTFNDQISFVIDNKEIVAKPGTLTVFSPYQVHREIYSEHSPRFIVIFINQEFFEAQYKVYTLEKNTVFSGERIEVPQGFISYIRDFIVEVDNKLSGWETVVESINLRICHSIVRSMLGLTIDFKHTNTRLGIDSTIEYMHKHLGDKLTIEQLASHTNMSPSHFSRVFKKETGKSVIRYLNEVRLEKVKRLLMLGEHSITEIAHECGFSSSSYLATAFFNKYGQSPSDYRKMFAKDFNNKYK